MGSKLLMGLVFCGLLFSASVSNAGDNSILDALKSDGVQVQSMDNTALAKARGTGYVENMPSPSYSGGVREYHVTWKKFGSLQDYRSYNIVSGSKTPNQFVNLGTLNDNRAVVGAGDVWLADTKSNVNSWSRANSVIQELHLNVLVETEPGSKVLGLTNLGYTESNWNRPLSTFNW